MVRYDELSKAHMQVKQDPRKTQIRGGEHARRTMDHRTPSRRSRQWTAFAALMCGLVLPGASTSAALRPIGARQQQQPPAPIERRPAPTDPGLPATAPTGTPYARFPGTREPEQRSPAAHGPRGEHLAQWMSQHSNLTPEQQQSALGHEPGFSTLPVETQQRMRDRLTQLNAMNPARRQRLLDRNEAMERLSPAQRGEVRGALAQLGSLPADQRMVVARTFRSLRDLPPEQRMAALNSGRFGQPLNDAQRAVMYNLLRVEPMLPPPSPEVRPPVNPPANAFPQEP